MKKLLLLISLLLPLASCDQKDEEEDLSELKRMVQAPESSSSSSHPSKEVPEELIKR